MIYKNYIITVYILFCIQIVHVRSLKAVIYSHDNAQNEDFDITTIYRTTTTSSSFEQIMVNGVNRINAVGFMNEGFLQKYKGFYVIEIRSRTNAIGIPIQNNNYTSILINSKELFNAESIGSFQNNSHMNISYNSLYWTERSIRLDENEMYWSLEYKYGIYYSFYGKLYGYTTLFSLHWIPDIDSKCLTITYIHRVVSELDILLSIFNENNTLIASIRLEKDDYNIKTVKVTDMVFMKDQKYTLIIEMRTQAYHNNDNPWFGLYQIAQCSNYDEDLRFVSTNDFNALRYPREFKLLGDASDAKSFTSFKSTDSCLNGGYKTDISKEKCVCPPGFKGKLCETGCGMNSYGADCNGICSINAKQMCRRMLMCTNYGCTCPVGLTGPLCDQDCMPGLYGANCNQSCSAYCQNSCDRYTGVCLNGCSPGYKMPYCREKYPYLINPPTLISIDYETIQIEINFESNNVRYRNDNLILKYYQLSFYKSLDEDNISTSEIKLINQSNSRIVETIIDLQQGTKYMVGVLLITDDLNYNENDIVYTEFITLCEQSQYIDYNISLVNRVKGVNVTWNKIIPSRFECHIIVYVLTLMADRSHHQIYDVQEIIASSDTGHFIDGLLPNFSYNLKLTPKTIKGPLPSSPIYSIVTLSTGNDDKIRDVTIKNEEDRIKVYWNLENLHQNISIESEPVTCVIRYKIKRILSCSKSELINNWTSINIFNQTNYEIIDVIPNSQYAIQVLTDKKDIDYSIHQDTVYVTTSGSSPKTGPNIDHEHPIYITNNSVKVQWKVNPEDCSKLNGFFSKFYIKLKDIINNTFQTKETTRNYISFDDLKPKTAYELKVFIKNHVGLNVEHFLFISFTTKYADLKLVEDLMVYKKSLKNRMAGFRWSYTNDTNMDGFIVSYNGNAFKNTKDVSLTPKKCSAWPEYYCHTFYNMTPSSNYTIKIKPRSLDNPEGGKISSISFNSIDGLPGAPTNVITTEISNTYVTLQWDIPWIFNGALKMFSINAEEISALDMNMCCDSILPIEIPFEEELPTYNYTLTDLKPGSTYSIGVLTISKSLWYSSTARISVTLQEE